MYPQLPTAKRPGEADSGGLPQGSAPSRQNGHAAARQTGDPCPAAAPHRGYLRTDPASVAQGRHGPRARPPRRSTAGAGLKAPTSPRETAAGLGPASRQQPQHSPGARRGARGRSAAQLAAARPPSAPQPPLTAPRHHRPPAWETSPLTLAPRAPNASATGARAATAPLRWPRRTACPHPAQSHEEPHRSSLRMGGAAAGRERAGLPQGCAH